MTMNMVRFRRSGLVQVPAPSGKMRGFSQCIIGRRAFYVCLEKVAKSQGAQSRAVLLAVRG
jgi:hypothetical protein